MAEKPYKPTARRLREARRQGEVIRSRELATLAAFLGVWLLLGFAAGYFYRHVANIVDRALAAASGSPESWQQSWSTSLQGMIYEVLWILGPLLGACIGCSVLVSGLQTRGVFSWAPLRPNLERINPGEGLRNLLSVRNLLELGKMLLKTMLLIGLLGYALMLSLDSIVKMIDAPAGELLRLAGVLAWRLMGLALIPYAIGSALDYAVQFYQFMKRHKMSIEELRRDYQETEGNPRIKARRRAVAQETLAAADLTRVTSATVVVVDINRVSVALEYTADTPLPKVVAKGHDALAVRIRRQAEESGVPVMENPGLAGKLASVPIDHYIGEELIDPVATVIRWARQADRRQKL